MLKSIFCKIISDKKQGKKLNSLKNKNEIYKLFCKNGYKKSYDKFEEEIKAFLNSEDGKNLINNNFDELSDEMLEMVAGGLNFDAKYAVTAGIAALITTFTVGTIGSQMLSQTNTTTPNDTEITTSSVDNDSNPSNDVDDVDDDSTPSSNDDDTSTNDNGGANTNKSSKSNTIKNRIEPNKSNSGSAEHRKEDPNGGSPGGNNGGSGAGGGSSASQVQKNFNDEDDFDDQFIENFGYENEDEDDYETIYNNFKHSYETLQEWADLNKIDINNYPIDAQADAVFMAYNDIYPEEDDNDNDNDTNQKIQDQKIQDFKKLATETIKKINKFMDEFDFDDEDDYPYSPLFNENDDGGNKDLLNLDDEAKEKDDKLFSTNNPFDFDFNVDNKQPSKENKNLLNLDDEDDYETIYENFTNSYREFLTWASKNNINISGEPIDIDINYVFNAHNAIYQKNDDNDTDQKIQKFKELAAETTKKINQFMKDYGHHNFDDENENNDWTPVEVKKEKSDNLLNFDDYYENERRNIEEEFNLNKENDENKIEKNDDILNENQPSLSSEEIENKKKKNTEDLLKLVDAFNKEAKEKSQSQIEKKENDGNKEINWDDANKAHNNFKDLNGKFALWAIDNHIVIANLDIGQEIDNVERTYYAIDKKGPDVEQKLKDFIDLTEKTTQKIHVFMKNYFATQLKRTKTNEIYGNFKKARTAFLKKAKELNIGKKHYMYRYLNMVNNDYKAIINSLYNPNDNSDIEQKIQDFEQLATKVTQKINVFMKENDENYYYKIDDEENDENYYYKIDDTPEEIHHTFDELADDTIGWAQSNDIDIKDYNILQEINRVEDKYNNLTKQNTTINIKNFKESAKETTKKLRLFKVNIIYNNFQEVYQNLSSSSIRTIYTDILKIKHDYNDIINSLNNPDDNPDIDEKIEDFEKSAKETTKNMQILLQTQDLLQTDENKTEVKFNLDGSNLTFKQSSDENDDENENNNNDDDDDYDYENENNNDENDDENENNNNDYDEEELKELKEIYDNFKELADNTAKWAGNNGISRGNNGISSIYDLDIGEDIVNVENEYEKLEENHTPTDIQNFKKSVKEATKKLRLFKVNIINNNFKKVYNDFLSKAEDHNILSDDDIYNDINNINQNYKTIIESLNNPDYSSNIDEDIEDFEESAKETMKNMKQLLEEEDNDYQIYDFTQNKTEESNISQSQIEDFEQSVKKTTKEMKKFLEEEDDEYKVDGEYKVDDEEENDDYQTDDYNRNKTKGRIESESEKHDLNDSEMDDDDEDNNFDDYKELKQIYENYDILTNDTVNWAQNNYDIDLYEQEIGDEVLKLDNEYSNLKIDNTTNIQNLKESLKEAMKKLRLFKVNIIKNNFNKVSTDFLSKADDHNISSDDEIYNDINNINQNYETIIESLYNPDYSSNIDKDIEDFEESATDATATMKRLLGINDDEEDNYDDNQNKTEKSMVSESKKENLDDSQIHEDDEEDFEQIYNNFEDLYNQFQKWAKENNVNINEYNIDNDIQAVFDAYDAISDDSSPSNIQKFKDLAAETTEAINNFMGGDYKKDNNNDSEMNEYDENENKIIDKNILSQSDISKSQIENKEKENDKNKINKDEEISQTSNISDSKIENTEENIPNQSQSQSQTSNISDSKIENVEKARREVNSIADEFSQQYETFANWLTKNAIDKSNNAASQAIKLAQQAFANIDGDFNNVQKVNAYKEAAKNAIDKMESFKKDYINKQKSITENFSNILAEKLKQEIKQTTDNFATTAGNFSNWAKDHSNIDQSHSIYKDIDNVYKQYDSLQNPNNQQQVENYKKLVAETTKKINDLMNKK